MDTAERVAVETALRRMLGTRDLALERSARKGSAELHVGRNLIGTVEAVDDEDGRSLGGNYRNTAGRHCAVMA